MLQVLIDAIQTRKVLGFKYDGFNRVVEPHAVGISRTGKQVLRCYQVSGSHVKPGHRWDFCTLSEISGLYETGDLFASARPGYRKHDKHMAHIYAEL